MTFTSLRVVTTATWLPRDLASAGVVPVVADLGLDVPADTDGMAWWCPSRHAARLSATAVRTWFTAPPAPWQASLLTATSRPTTAVRVRELGGQAPVFAKVADIKHPQIPASVWPAADALADACHRAGVPGDAWALVTDVVEDFTAEYRCFVTGRLVVAASVYLADGLTWDHWETGEQPDATAAAGYAQSVVDALGDDQPPGWVLDVGVDRAGRWSVVEANPAWCANPYHGEPAGVVRTVLAAQDPDADPRWAWAPASPPAWARPLPIRT